jgi:uncharacterized membrane protein
MEKDRMTAFSDGVIAIIITIMVLEMKAPKGHDLSVLKPMIPIFISYVLSFINIAIYWNNHHHMMHAVNHVNGKILWANVHLLFWLSLIPFVTAWMGENDFSKWPVALYGIILLMCGIAYYVLSRSLLSLHGKESTLAAAVGEDAKGKRSILFYSTGIALCFVQPWIGFGVYVLVAAAWLIPDKRIEKKLIEEEEKEEEEEEKA